jgi:2-polyprenyl-3-methyl-5-hydroxy-6-metoxy-1,4-benzoquinol methylase
VKTTRSFWEDVARQPLAITPGTTDSPSSQWSEKNVSSCVEQLLGGISNLSYLCLLDFGCGEGRLTKGLADRVKEYTGVDISPTVLQRAKDLHRTMGVHYAPNAKFLLAPESLSQRHDFGIVVSWTVFMHLSVSDMLEQF